MAVRKRVRKSARSGKKKTVFEAEVYINGVRVAYRVCETRAEAEVWHDKTKKLHASGEAQEGQESTFLECFERYKAERLPELRGQTRQTYEGRFVYLVGEGSPLRHVRMAEFTDKTIDAWFRWLRQHPTAADSGRKHFRQEFILLRAILNWYRNCVDAKFIVPIVKRHRTMIHYKTVSPRRPDYFMRKEEIRDWLFHLGENRDAVYHELATFMVLTATRVGEAAGLFWDAVDLDNEIVTVIRTVWWDYHTKSPHLQEWAKTDESVRVIKLPPSLAAMLRRMRAGSDGSGPVFSDPKGGGLLRYRRIQYSFNASFKALGLPWRSPHICRHSFGTLALLASRDLSGVQAAMGHRNIKETEGYAKVVALIDGQTVTKTAEFIGL